MFEHPCVLDAQVSVCVIKLLCPTSGWRAVYTWAHPSPPPTRALVAVGGSMCTQWRRYASPPLFVLVFWRLSSVGRLQQSSSDVHGNRKQTTGRFGEVADDYCTRNALSLRISRHARGGVRCPFSCHNWNYTSGRNIGSTCKHNLTPLFGVILSVLSIGLLDSFSRDNCHNWMS